MPARTDLRSTLRALFGAWAGDRPAPLPDIPFDLPDDAQPVIRQAVAMLAQYQGVVYARLYLQRLRRFVGRRDVDAEMFLTIAAHMAVRMAYQDPVRVAQLLLNTPLESAPKQRSIKFRLDDLIEPLPPVLADPLLMAIDRLGSRQRIVTLQYYPHSRGGRGRLHFEASLRHWRALGRACERERLWVERWLHMIDRALTRRPDAAAAIVDSATMIRGYGEPYRRALADWHLIIDGLAKPVFDGTIDLPDLAGAIDRARQAAGANHDELRATIAAIRESAAP